MTRDFEQAARELDAAIDAEATRLVQLGVPKWDAIIQARQRVAADRRIPIAPTPEPRAE